MTGYKEFFGLSPQSGAILDHLNSPSKLQKSLFSLLSPGDSSSGLSAETSITSAKSSIDIAVDDKLSPPAQTLTANKQAGFSLLFKALFQVSFLITVFV